MGPITDTTTPRRPNLVVGWAAGLVQVWPAEDDRIAQARANRPMAAPLGRPDAVLELLAAVDGTDEATYRRRFAADSGAVLALTHHTEAEVLAASLDLPGRISPSRMLAWLHAADPDELARLAS
jgi:hypothetical protein